MSAVDDQRPRAPVPARLSLAGRREPVQTCRACELWANATQAVFGSGARPARLMLVGEQPGDRENLEGEPFVGPAGGVLDRGLARAGLDRVQVYVTNVVKHFRYKARGRRRIHSKPAAVHVAACRPWLEAELRVVAPEALICLGATAAQALLGPAVRIGRDRGRGQPSELAALVTVTAHPASILRARGEDERRPALDGFVSDLEQVSQWLDQR